MLLFDTLMTTAGRFAGIDAVRPVNGAVRSVDRWRPAAQLGRAIVMAGGSGAVVVVLDVVLDVVVELLVVVLELVVVEEVVAGGGKAAAAVKSVGPDESN